jgi:Zn-finger nucleic acid-binding protein
MSKLCPVCRINMNEIFGKSETELSINIDKCPNCEGFWFDNRDLFLISSDIAKQHDKEITKKETPDSKSVDRICPNCAMPMILLKDPELSKTVQIDICPKCMGLWLDQGEFLRYKEYQKEKIEKVKKDDAIKAAEALKKFQNSKESGRFWKFLMKDPLRASESSNGTAFRNNLESFFLGLIKTLLGGFRR